MIAACGNPELKVNIDPDNRVNGSQIESLSHPTLAIMRELDEQIRALLDSADALLGELAHDDSLRASIEAIRTAGECAIALAQTLRQLAQEFSITWDGRCGRETPPRRIAP